jgi:hypothetical protein
MSNIGSEVPGFALKSFAAASRVASCALRVMDRAVSMVCSFEYEYEDDDEDEDFRWPYRTRSRPRPRLFFDGALLNQGWLFLRGCKKQRPVASRQQPVDITTLDLGTQNAEPE